MSVTIDTATKPSLLGAQTNVPVPRASAGTAFGCPREFFGNRFVYTVVSARARGLSVGVNLAPDKRCNFDCPYCEVDWLVPGRDVKVDLDVMAAELEATLTFVHAGKLREVSLYTHVPPDLLLLRHVAISGDGEPTLCPQFRQALETVVHLRATSRTGFFKIVLITNASNLDAEEVQAGLRLLTRRDEIWAKLDGGTQSYLERVNKTALPIEKILSNILLVARQRPLIIQSLFPELNGVGPGDEEISHYVQRLQGLKDAGAEIPLVQIYSATRPTPNSTCGHLPLRRLSQIAQTVRSVTGLNAEVF